MEKQKEKLNENMQTYWNHAADGFDEAHKDEDKERWFSYYQNLLGSADHQTVLDVGTGTGFLAGMSAKLGFQTYGIDFAENMLKEARRKAEQEKLEICYQKADLYQLPFADNSFDYVVNSRVLWTITDPQKAIHEWKRVLKSDGELLNFIRLTAENRMYTAHDIYEDVDLKYLPFSMASVKEIKDTCEKAGFTNIDLIHLPGITTDVDLYGDWYVLRAGCGVYRQTQAIHAISGFWDRRADTYEGEHQIWPEQLWKSYLHQIIGSDKEQHIVDLATGTGMIANLLGEEGYLHVTGMDISEGMMAIARKHAEEKHTCVQFRYGNALELPLEDNSIDILINCRLLWTLTEPEAALQEWARVVKPGGKIISLHELEEHSDEKEEIWKKALYGKNADPFMPLRDSIKEDIFNLYQKSGMDNIQMLHMDGCHTADSKKNNWYAMIGTVNQNKGE